MRTALSAILTIVADLTLKFFILRSGIPVIKNTGLAFSLPAAPEAALIFQAAIMAALLFLYFFLGVKNANRISQIGWGFIFGGASGNLLERIVRGFVTDYIPVALSSLNLADLAILIGVALIALHQFFNSK